VDGACGLAPDSALALHLSRAALQSASEQRTAVVSIAQALYHLSLPKISRRFFAQAVTQPMSIQSTNRCPHRSSVFRPRLVFVALLAALTLSSGCSFPTFNFPPGEREEPDLLDLLPVSWYPIFPGNEWRAVSIDDDGEDEYLLLYAYNTVPQTSSSRFNNQTQLPQNAPLGAIILDGQTSSESVVDYPPLATPLQPMGAFIPYRVAPSYWPEPNSAYVGLYSNPDQIKVAQYATDPAGLCAPGVEEARQELVIFDTRGDSVLTNVWWRSAYLGYGVAQILAPGGLRNAQTIAADGNVTPLDLSGDLNEGGLVWSVDALHPIYQPLNPLSTEVEGGFADLGRSQLCDVYRYYRQTDLDTSGSKVRGDIRYVDDYMGIEFCRSSVPAPFFPEAVVLKFLLEPDARQDLIHDRVTEEEQQVIDAYLNDMDRKVSEPGTYCGDSEVDAMPMRRQHRVSDIQTRAALEFTDDYRLNRSDLQTEVRQLRAFVCAEITAIIPDPNAPYRELLFFTLGHIPPEDETRNGVTTHYTDRLRVLRIDQATEWGYDDCRTLIAANHTEVEP
jgi:hypothetical protein